MNNVMISGNVFTDGLMWVVERIGDGFVWLVKEGAGLMLEGAGEFCKFMVTEVSNSFLLFGMLGMFLVMAGAKEKGLRMVNLSLVVYVVMLVVASVC